MNNIAFFTENLNISYTAIIVTAAVVAAIVCAVLTAAAAGRSVTAVLTCAGVSMILAPLCSKLLYWYCAPEQFDGALQMFSDMNSGGYCLAGAMIGVVLAAFITSRMNMSESFLPLLDCIAPAAALGIGLGRLAGFVSGDDKGNYVFDSEAFHWLPLSYPVTDKVTGAVQWRFASFFWEALAGLAIFAVLMVMLLKGIQSGSGTQTGDPAMTFLCLFGATQASLESTRYDVLHMRSNGFISMMQMLALVMILVPPIYYTVRGLKAVGTGGTTVRLVLKWAAIVAAVGGAGAAEYFIQRKGSLALMIYPVQMLLLIGAALVTFSIRKDFFCDETAAEASPEDSPRE